MRHSHSLPVPVLCALVLGAASGPCSAAWVKIADADQSVICLDTAISQKVGHKRMVWLLRDPSGPRVGATGPYLSSKDQVKLDCRARRVRRSYAADHARAMGEGRFVHSGHGPMGWNDAAPRSTMGRVVGVACADAGRRR